MDVKQALDAVMANPAAYARSILLAVVVIAALIALFRVGPRLWRVIEEVFFTNWQLAMLGTAAIVLSLAGGWTTWDGMTNFTGEPVLSLMFTFGIHGVMLIVAWLIGESFATGMSTVPRSGIARVTAPLVVVIGLGVVLLAAAAAFYQWKHGIEADYWIQALTAAGLVFGVLGLLTVFARTDVVDAVRAGAAHHGQELDAVGDVPRLHGDLGVLLLRQPLQRRLPQRAARARVGAARDQPGVGHHRRYRRHHRQPSS